MEQPQITVTLSLLTALVILCALPIWKYGPSEALKFVTAFLTFFSFIGGSVITYFLAQKQVAAARTQAAEYRATATKAGIALDNFASAVASKPDDAKLFELKADPRYKSATKTFTDLEPTIEMFRLELGNQRQPSNQPIRSATAHE